jgi:hypothetical protein
MARPEVTGRARAGIQRRVRKPTAGKTIDQFCEKWGISRSTFNSWRKKKKTPAVLQPIPGGLATITDEAEEIWQRENMTAA